MGRPKVIFYSAFFVFNLLLFLFTLYVDANRSNFDVLFALQSRISQMKYFASLGLILSIVAFAISLYSNMKYKKELEKLQSQQNEYKAKLFDLQKEMKKANPTVKISDSPQRKASGDTN